MSSEGSRPSEFTLVTPLPNLAPSFAGAAFVFGPLIAACMS